MLSRRYSIVAILVVAASAGAAVILAATSHATGATSSSDAVTGSAVAGSAIRANKDDPPITLPRAHVADGPQPSAFLRPARATDTPLKPDPELVTDIRRVATARHLGVDHAVYVGKDGKGLTCVILQEGPSGRGGGGCNPSNGPFVGSNVLWSSTQYNEAPNKLVVFGTVTAKVAAMSIVLGSGETSDVPLSDDGGFIYVVTKPSIEPSDVPRSIITFDSSGHQIEQTPLGITFGP